MRTVGYRLHPVVGGRSTNRFVFVGYYIRKGRARTTALKPSTTQTCQLQSQAREPFKFTSQSPGTLKSKLLQRYCYHRGGSRVCPLLQHVHIAPGRDHSHKYLKFLGAVTHNRFCPRSLCYLVCPVYGATPDSCRYSWSAGAGARSTVCCRTLCRLHWSIYNVTHRFSRI